MNSRRSPLPSNGCGFWRSLSRIVRPITCPWLFTSRVGSIFPALEQSFAEIIRRHEALRTTFPIIDGQPVQQIEAVDYHLPMVDLSPLPADQRELEAARLIEMARQIHFDLISGPFYQIRLLRLSAEQKHVLLISIHHIIFDEWSYDILCRELAAFYDAFNRQESVTLPEPIIQYADFAAWQRERLQGERLQTQLAYWEQQLAGAPQALALPTDHPRPAVQSLRGAQAPVHFPKHLSDGLKQLSQQAGTTLFMTLLAAFNVLMYRYSNQEDIVVGTPISNRTHAETEPLIGMFLNTIAMRTDLSGSPSFRELFYRVREVALEAYDHQEFPFEKLVEALQLERDLEPYASLSGHVYSAKHDPIGSGAAGGRD